MKILFVTLFIVLIDQAAKLLVKGFSIFGLSHKGLETGEKIPLIGSWLNISFVENPGIALGIDFGAEYKTYLTIFTFAAAAGLLVYLYRMRTRNFILRFSLALILGGAVGNLIDRAFYGLFYGYAPFLHGKVVDFIDVRMFNLFIFNKTVGNYVLNIADIAVSLGVVILMFSLSREKDTAAAEETPADNILAENKE
jgi:signal peptidase II